MILICGAFNPITNAHVLLGTELYDKFKERIVYVPASDNYILNYKKQNPQELIPQADRYNLIRKSILFTICNMEMNNQLSGYAVDTINYFEQNMIEDVKYVIGADQLPNLHKWHNSEELLKKKFIVVTRKGYKLEQNNLPNFTFVELNLPNVSSTIIRQHVKNGNLEAIKTLVPRPVYEYYKEHTCIK